MSKKNILDKFKLKGKVAIVTGASRGLGQAMAIGLAEAGADLVLVARSNMDATEKEIKSTGQKCIQVQADLASIEPVQKILNKAVNEFGRIDILVNNAGTIRRAPITEFTMEDWDDVMNVNLRTLFYLSQQVAKKMIDQGEGGKIINIASMLSYEGGILVPSYTASKSGVMGLTRLMGNELAKHNINCNAIAPGYMATDNTAPLREDPERNEAIVNRIPEGRWGEPEDLQGAAVFLASAASDYMQGETIAVDGGWLSR
ncbi:MAG TPA: 2-dehydro-3-deoxy-D-gluconate 5-dehydrogenase KduD [bacterium]|nr:2-dehydro-3-deoxy-D-gluconate 5-dehydrogenase KduD [bacterium]